MKLFGKKKETKSCCCGENCTSETMQNTENKKQEQRDQNIGFGLRKMYGIRKSNQSGSI